jgi:hypothetical protein
VLLGVVGAAIVFGALATLSALAMPPFTSGDEAQHASYALDVGSGTLPVLDTPVRSLIPGMPGVAATCVVTEAEARAGLAVAQADLEKSDLRVAVKGPVSVITQIASSRAMPACVRGKRGVVSNNQTTYTANHPPLFYALEAAPLTAGVHAGHALAGFRAARLLNVAIGMAAVVAVAWLVRELVPARPDLAVASAALTGTVGLLVAVSSQLYNDALALATITGALAATVALIRRGPSPWRLAMVGGLALAAASSRASGLLEACLVIPAAGVAVALHPARTRLFPARRPAVIVGAGTAAATAVRTTWWRQLARGAAAGAAGALLVAGGIGWFYLRNVRLYGDATGAGIVARMFPAAGQRMTVPQVLESRTFWTVIYDGSFGRGLLLRESPLLTHVPTALGGVLGLGLCLAALRRAARWLADRRSTGAAEVPVEDALASAREAPTAWMPPRWLLATVAWLLVALHVAIAVATLVGYVASGGFWLTRYVLPSVSIVALLLAVALAAIPGGRRGMPTVLAVAGLAATNVVMLTRELAYKFPRLGHLSGLRRLEAAMTMSGLRAPAAVLWLIAVAAVLGLACLTVSLWPLTTEAVPRWPVPRLSARRQAPHPDRHPSLAEALTIADRRPVEAKPMAVTEP